MMTEEDLKKDYKEREMVLKQQLEAKYNQISNIEFLSCIRQTWGMIGDEWDVKVTLDGQEKLWMICAKETENNNYEAFSGIDKTDLQLTSSIRSIDIPPFRDIYPVVYAENSDMNTLDKWQLERLCNIVYLNHILDGGKSGKEKMTVLIKELEEEIKQGYDHPNEMTQNEWEDILNSVKEDEMLMDLKVIDILEYTDEEHKNEILPGMRVVTFSSSDNQNLYLIYRGTHGDDEWRDNAYGMIEADTIQQKASLVYLRKIHAQFPHKYLAVAGHSKGGNKAQYVALTAPDDVVNFAMCLDGQGFSAKFLDKYEYNIKNRKYICRMAEQRDYVNCLGLYLDYNKVCASPPTEFYRGYRGLLYANKSSIYGYPISLFHCPDALRLKLPVFGSSICPFPSGMGQIPSWIAHLMEDFLTTDTIPDDKKKKTAEYFVTYLMEHPSPLDYKWNAIVIIAIELLRNLSDINFIQKIENTIGLEIDALIATLVVSKDKTGNDIIGAMDRDECIGDIVMAIINNLNEIIRNKDKIENGVINIAAFFAHLFSKCFEVSGLSTGALLLLALIINLIKYLFKACGETPIKFIVKEIAAKIDTKMLSDLVDALDKNVNMDITEKEYLALCKKELSELEAVIRELDN